MKTYTTPSGGANVAALAILNQSHVLIAGATGSGKSVLINTILYNTLLFSPFEKQLILIDPKRVELLDYAYLPHTLTRATEPEQIENALKSAVNLLERRFREMERKRLKQYPGSDVYIIIDELADILTTQKRRVLPLLQRIAQIGRAARIHLIMATQRPTKDILSGQLKVNIDCRIALRCAEKQDSRNIIERPGAELLPRYGVALYRSPEYIDPIQIEIEMTPQSKIAERVEFWRRQNTPISLINRLKRRRK